MERKYNNQTEDSRLQSDLSDSHCSQDETIQEARFCLCCSWAEGCGKCPGGWQPDVSPSWPSLLQDKAERCIRGQWWVGKDTHQSLAFVSPAPQQVFWLNHLGPGGASAVSLLLSWVCVTACPQHGDSGVAIPRRVPAFS